MKLSRGTDTGWPSINAEQAVANMTFDCVLHFETQLPTGGFFILIDRFVNDVAAVVVVIAACIVGFLAKHLKCFS